MFGTLLLSRTSFSAASARACFSPQAFAAATPPCFHLFLCSACNCCLDNTFISKWVKAWERNTRTKPINGRLCSSLNVLMKILLVTILPTCQQSRDSCWLSYCVLGYWVSHQHPPHTAAHCPASSFMCTHADTFVGICTHKDTRARTRVQKRRLRETN